MPSSREGSPDTEEPPVDLGPDAPDWTGAPFPVVGIGASAGGIEATLNLLAAVSPSTGMAFVVIQHLSPQHPSELAEVLGRRTTMPVVAATHNVKIEPDHVYVIPPGKNMVLADGRLQLAPRTELWGQHRSIDHFLRSLATEQGYRAVAVILSGRGSDGSLGVEEVKAGGGIVLAQDDSAEQTSMPRGAVGTGAVDHVLSPERIGAELAEIAVHLAAGLRHPTAAIDDEEAWQAVIDALRDGDGVDFSFYKRSTLGRRISRRMVLRRCDSVSAYAQLLANDPHEVEALYQDILINVTSFFRDDAGFDELKRTVFPKILANRTRHEPIRVWTLGCSTGEEAYSVAMAYTEFAEAADKRVPMTIFATDLNGVGIEKARAGLYSKGIEQDVSPDRLRRFFVDVDGSYRIIKSIRDMCVFARQNALADPPFSRMDLVICRNMLIYLEPVLQRRLIPMLHYSLRSPGFLWLGMSETIGAWSELFELVDPKFKIYSRRDGPGNRPISIADRRTVDIRPSPRPVLDPGTTEAHREADRLLAARYAPPGVLVNGDLDILQFRGDTTPYLAPSPGRASLSLMKMVREGLAGPLRIAARQAMDRGEVVRQQGLRVLSNDRYRDVAIEVIPMRQANGAAALILFEDHSNASPGNDGPASSASSEEGPDDEISRLTSQLLATQQHAQSMIEQHEAANEELQSANEEVQSANEELQSINEELETSKEEIQSTNEELATVNSELEDRNIQLAQIANDLSNLLASVDVPIAMFGRDLRLRNLTAAGERVLALHPGDVGRAIGELHIELSLDLAALLARVVDDTLVEEREITDRSGRWYLLRARPYRTLEGHVDGVVLLLVDIDAIKRSESAMRETEARFALLADSAPVLIWVSDADGFRYVNRAYREYVGRASEHLGRFEWTQDLHPEDREPYLAAWLDAAARGQRFEAQMRLRRADGEYRWMKSVATPRRTDTGDLVGLVGCSYDIHDLKEAERSLRDADIAKDRFLAILAHELRNPLAAISNAETILDVTESGSPQAERAKAVLKRQTATMVRLIDDLLDVSRITHGVVHLQTGPTDLLAVVRQSVESTSHELVAAGVDVEVSLPATPIRVTGDPVRLDQVFVNLLTNAAKFVPRGSRVRISAARVDDEHAEVRVVDDGVGVAPDKLDAMFELFGQLDASSARRGLGLGLPLSRRLVELHGGQLWAESAGAGTGTTLIVRLPLLVGGESDRKERVLVVDDEPDSAETLRTLLDLHGFDVAVASTAADALDVARKIVPDVVLLDLSLPDVDGWEVARRLREDIGLRHATIAAVSGLGTVADRVRSHEVGMDHHFTKPVDVDAVVALIRQRGRRS